MCRMRLRVLTYNIKDGGLGREAHILEVLQAARPHVIGLQEVYAQTGLQQWADSLNMAFALARGNTRRHLAIMSQLPILSCRSYHPRPPLQTCLLEAQLSLDSRRALHIYGVHLLAQPFIAMELWRVWEVATILRRIRMSLGSLALVLGDFNAIAPGDRVNRDVWPWGLKLMVALQAGHIFRAAIGRMQSDQLFDCYRQLHPADTGFTLPASAPNTRLDYAFASPALIGSLRACTVVREPAAVRLASDHCPLLLEFEL
jgi:exonuclease III